MASLIMMVVLLFCFLQIPSVALRGRMLCQWHSWTHQKERWQGFSRQQTLLALRQRLSQERGLSSVGRPTKMTKNQRCFYAVRSPIPSEKPVCGWSNTHILLLLPLDLIVLIISLNLMSEGTSKFYRRKSIWRRGCASMHYRFYKEPCILLSDVVNTKRPG